MGGRLHVASPSRTRSNLYLVMEFLPGGDMMTLFIKKDTFSEDETGISTSLKLLLAIQSIRRSELHPPRHQASTTLLLDANGHIKLADSRTGTGLKRSTGLSSIETGPPSCRLTSCPSHSRPEGGLKRGRRT